MELDTAEAGKRIMIETGTQLEEARFEGIQSSFPEWIPSDLRSKKLVREVMDYMDRGKEPTKGKVKELYDIVKQEIADRAGVSVDDITKPTEITPAIKKQLEKRAKALIRGARVGGKEPPKTTIRKATGQAILEGKVAIKPSVLLREKLKSLEEGGREGRISTKKEIKSSQEEVIDIIDRSDLDLKDKAKFRKTIKNIQTREQLQKAIPEIQERISELEEKATKRDLQQAIEKELKYTKPVKKGQRKVGKYDYESNKLFETIRSNNKLSQEKALAELNSIPKEDLSEKQKIIARFLSYKVNGMKGSVALHAQVLSDIQEMKRIGEEAKNEAEFNKKLEKQEKIEEILEAVEKQKAGKGLLGKIFKGPQTLYVSSVANLYSSLNTVAGKKVADKYDYAYHQTNSRHDADNKTDLAVEKAKEIYKVKSNRQLNKIFIKDLAPQNFVITDIEGRKIPITKFDLMNIYNGIKNDLIKERMYKHFGEEQTTSLLKNLTPEDTKLADYLMEEVQEYKEVLNQRSIEISGRDNGDVGIYWPAKSEYQAEFFDDIRVQGEVPSAMKERSKSSAVVPEMANAWLIFQRHIKQAEHIKSVSRRYEELKNIFSDRRVKQEIKNKFGDEVYGALIGHIETLSLNQESTKMDLFSGIYNRALNNWVKAKLASPTIFARQLISSAYSVGEVGVENYTKYTKEVIANPEKAVKFMWDNVPFVKARFKRGYSEAVQDVIKGTNNLKVGIDSITKYTSMVARGGDITGVVLNGYPIMKTELAKHGDMERAVAETQKFSEKTQGSGSLANLGAPQRSRNAFARTFYRFKNTLNQLLRLQTDASIQFINKQISAKEFATKTALYSVYTPIMYVLIGYAVREGWKGLFGKGGDDDEEESLFGDIVQNMLLQPFKAIPLLDMAMENAYAEARKRITGKDYYYGEGLFSYPLLDDIATAWSKLKKKEPSAEDLLRVLSLIQEPVTGFPTESILRYFRYATEKEKKESGLKPAKPRPEIKLEKDIKLEKEIKLPEIRL